MARMTLRGEALVYYERFREKFDEDLGRMQKQTGYRSDGAWERLLQNTLASSRKWVGRPLSQGTLASFFDRTFPALNPRFSLDQAA